MLADRITRSCVREHAATDTDASLPDGSVMATKRPIHAWAKAHPNPCPFNGARLKPIAAHAAANPHADQYRS